MQATYSDYETTVLSFHGNTVFGGEGSPVTEETVTGGSAASGISRRRLIKAGVIVGGSVWVAPVIDSFVSRASAASAPPCSNPCSVSITSCQVVSGASTITAGDCLRIDYNFQNAPATGTVQVTNAYLVLVPYTGPGSPNASCEGGGQCGSPVKVYFPDQTFTLPCPSGGCHETFTTTAPTVAGCPSCYEVAFQFFASVCGAPGAKFQATLSFTGYHGCDDLGSYSETVTCG